MAWAQPGTVWYKMVQYSTMWYLHKMLITRRVQDMLIGMGTACVYYMVQHGISIRKMQDMLIGPLQFAECGVGSTWHNMGQHAAGTILYNMLCV